MESFNRKKNILTGYNMLLYFAGTMIMYEPSEECVYDFWTNGILRKLPVSSSNPNFVKAASQLRNSCTDKIGCQSSLQADYIRLFMNKEESLALPYEALYRNSANNSSKNKISSASDFYDSYGWKSKYKPQIGDDHIAVELLFLTKLIEKYLEFDDNACMVEMAGEIRRFIDEHLFSWIGEWNKKIQLNSYTTGYKGIATLIVACVEDIYSIFSRNTTTLYSVEELRN